MDMCHVTLARVYLDGAAGNYRAMAEGGRKATELAAEAGMRYVEILGVENEVCALVALGKLDNLDKTLSRLRRLISGTCFDHYECQVRFLDAYATLMYGDAERGRGLAKDAVAFARAHHFQFPHLMSHAVVPATVLAEALRMGVETDTGGRAGDLAVAGQDSRARAFRD